MRRSGSTAYLPAPHLSLVQQDHDSAALLDVREAYGELHERISRAASFGSRHSDR
jgi:hypothetical protein